MHPSRTDISPDLPAELGRHADFLRSLAQRLVQNPADAEDLVQDTFAVALDSGPKDPRPLRPWLAAVLGRKSQNHFKREAFRRNAAGGADLDARPARSEPCTVEIVEFSKRLLSMVEGLGEPYTETVVLRFYEGLGPKAIAQRLGVPVSTVQSRLARGLGRLRSQLDREHEGDREAWLSAAAGLVSSGATQSAVSTGSTLLTPWLLKVGAVAALLVGAVVVADLVTHPGTPSAESLAPSPESPSASALALASLTPGAAGETRVPGSFEPTQVVAASSQSEVLTIIGSVSDLELGGEPGSGVRVGPGVRVEYNAYHGGRQEGGASVATASNAAGLPYVETDAEGGFRLEVERDGLTVLQLWVEGTALLHKQEWARRNDDVPRGEATVDLQRYPHGPLAGTVKNTSGLPMGELQIALPRKIGEPATLTTTGPDGRFVFENVESEMNLRAVDERYTCANNPWSTRRARGGWEDVTMVLSEQGTIRVRCVDASGEPAPNCAVFVALSSAEPVGSTFAPMAVQPMERHTDDEGVVLLNYIPSDVKLLVGSRSLGVQCFGLRSEGGSSHVGTDEEDDPGATAIMVSAGEELELTLRAKRSYRVTGLVTDATGEPIGGVWVTVERPGVPFPLWRSAIREVQTDATGRYHAQFHVPTDVELVVVRAGSTAGDNDAPGASAQLQLAEPGLSNLDLQISPRHQLSGRVVDGTDSPVAGALVVARLHDVEGRLLSTEPLVAKTREDGFIEAKWLEAAPAGAELWVTASHGAFHPVELRLAPSACADLNLQLLQAVDAQITIRLEPMSLELDSVKIGWGSIPPGQLDVESLRPLGSTMSLPPEHSRKFPRFEDQPRLDLDLLHLRSFRTFEGSDASHTISIPSGAGWLAVTAVTVDGQAMTTRTSGLCAISPGEHEIRAQLVPMAELAGRIVSADGTETENSERLCYSVRTMNGLLERPVGWSMVSTSIFHLAEGGRFRLMHLPTGNHELLIGTRAELLADAPRRIEPFTLVSGENEELAVEL